MDFSDIVLEVFHTDDKEEELITEQGLLITPFLAFSAFKKKAFNNLKSKFTNVKEAPNIKLQKAKAAGKEFKEKARAATGQSSGKGEDATVYKLTKEQMDVMSDIYKEYGKEITKEIIDFRKNVLAPYQLIKRQIKGSSRVTSKDKLGMTKEEFKSSLESGRKKIQARGEKFFERSEDLQDKLKKYTEQLEGLNQAQEAFEKGTELSPNVVNKIYKKFGAGGTSFEGYSPEELRKVYDEIERNYQSIIDQLEKAKGGETDPEKAIELSKKARDLWSGKSIDLTKAEKDEFFKKGDFNTALGTYFFRRDILDKLRPGQSNVFRETYRSIVKEMKEAIQEKRKETLQKLSKMRSSVEFNEKEAKIWKKRPTVKSFSGDMDDYYQDVKEEEFEGLPKYIERSPELKEAEQKIENEIRKFERKLQKILSNEDYKKLKQYRLINNLISIKDLKDPSNLFKSSDELKQAPAPKKDDKKTGEYVSPDDFVRKVKEIASREYDTIRELNAAKEEMNSLVAQMKEQGEQKVVEDNMDIVRRFKIRRSLKPQELRGHAADKDLIVDINDIETLARKIVSTEYSSIDKAKQDFTRLKSMISKYKEEEGDEAERNLKEVDFLLNRVNMKLQREVS